MRVIVSFVGGWGHAEPLLPMAMLARRHGHQVSVAGQQAVSAQLDRLGFATDVVGPDTLTATPQPLAPVDREREESVMREHFVLQYGRLRATRLGELFDRERAELVVCDEVDVGAVAAAELRGIPCVTVNVIAAGRLSRPAVVGAAWDVLRREHGLAPDPAAERIGGDLVIAPLPRPFRSPSVRTPATMRFVRPSVLDEVERAPDDLDDRPLVYATLGTVFNVESGDLLVRLVRAMDLVSERHGVEGVITTGANLDPEWLPVPRGGVRVVPFVPQREVLARCRAVVCHGGSGTLVAAMSLGIPVVVLPMGADQPDNADRCEALGVGLVLDAITASPSDITAATEAVLHDPRFRNAAAALAAEAAAQPALAHLSEVRALLENRRSPPTNLQA